MKGEARPSRGFIERGVVSATLGIWIASSAGFSFWSGRAWFQVLLFWLVTGLALVIPTLVARELDRRALVGIAKLTQRVREVGDLVDGETPPADATPDSTLEGRGDLEASARRLSAATRRLQARFLEAKTAEERAHGARKNAERARGLLFAGVSHDLKSPLNALLGFADLMTLDPLTDGQRESLHLILSRGRELVALVETIFDSARVEAGQLRLTMRPSNIAPILRDARTKAGELVHAPTGVEVIVDDGLPLVGADAAHLTRAFALVIAHALKSSSRTSNADVSISHAGEPTVHSPTPNRGVSAMDSVVVLTRNVGHEIRVDVEHRAGGPTAAALEEFYFTKKRERGLRLGLRLARTILELHGGRIEVFEKTNGRPTVSCFVPLADEATSARRVEAQPKSVP